MIRKLEGNKPYEMVKNANGDLAAKLKSLISKYAEDARVYELANEFITWWNMPFDDPGKDEAGRGIWNAADHLKEVLDAEYAAATPVSNPMSTPISMLERAGDMVGRTVGKAAGITANVTIAGANATHKWMKDSAVPASRAGCREFWKGLKVAARATRAAYRESRAKPASHTETDEDALY